MNKNAERIKNSIKDIAQKPDVIVSGKVVAGSMDETNCSINVQPSAGGKPIVGVLLNSILNSSDGMVLYPADDSDVIIGSTDGTGEWFLLRANKLTKVVVKIEGVVLQVDANKVDIENGNVAFSIGNDLFRMKTASESLFALLRDLITYLTELTVTASGSASSVPINVADFSNLLTRLNNLLTV